ncbi:MAG: glycosyltransferase family 2 protein [Bacteroidota bacterium]
MKKITIVIPALNEELGIGAVIKEIPIKILNDMGFETEIMVIDNGSKDKTKNIAREHGAVVIVQPIRGYGNAYKAGFANANGEVIATGDADLTYPFSILPKVLRRMKRENLDFINTNRLKTINTKVMSKSHIFGNYLLTTIMKILFKTPFRDSQSGMWIFRTEIWDKLNVSSSGMPFSQELKIEAYIKGFKCAEIPIIYRARAGKEKLNTFHDGIGNLSQLFYKKIKISSSITTHRITYQTKFALDKLLSLLT